LGTYIAQARTLTLFASFAKFCSPFFGQQQHQNSSLSRVPNDMKKLLGFALLFFLSAIPAFGQSKAGSVTAASTDCSVSGSCVSMTLSTSAGAATITLGGSFSGTLNFELSGDNGVTWTAAPTASSTSAGVTNFNVAGYSNIRVRGNPFASGTANVTIFAGAGSKLGAGAATGTVTAVNGTAPIVSDGSSTTPTISCPTCTTSAAAITNNVLAKGSGGAQGLANSSVTDNGTTVSTSELVNFSGTGAASTSPFLLNGTAFTGGTGTTNFPYFYMNFGAAPSSFSTGGVLLGINAPSGFLGNVIEEHLNGGSAVFSVSQTGAINTTATISAVGVAQASKYQSSTNCSSSASPAVCASASMGTVNIAAAATTITVNTTAVTANSEIMVVEDSSLGSKLGVTCNTTIARTYAVTARTAATSFVITASAAPVTNPACLSYWVMN
jgi:hypothetical protein